MVLLALTAAHSHASVLQSGTRPLGAADLIWFLWLFSELLCCSSQWLLADVLEHSCWGAGGGVVRGGVGEQLQLLRPCLTLRGVAVHAEPATAQSPSSIITTLAAAVTMLHNS
jgi:hypothetical protein